MSMVSFPYSYINIPSPIQVRVKYVTLKAVDKISLITPRRSRMLPLCILVSANPAKLEIPYF